MRSARVSASLFAGVAAWHAKTGQTLFVSGPLPSPEPGVVILKKGTIHYESLGRL